MQRGITRASSPASSTGAAPGRVDSPPDVDHGRRRREHAARVIERALAVEEASAIGKRVRRDVEDAHHPRPRQSSAWGPQRSIVIGRSFECRHKCEGRATGTPLRVRRRCALRGLADGFGAGAARRRDRWRRPSTKTTRPGRRARTSGHDVVDLVRRRSSPCRAAPSPSPRPLSRFSSSLRPRDRGTWLSMILRTSASTFAHLLFRHVHGAGRSRARRYRPRSRA